MPDTISLSGIVATTPRHVTTTEGLEITSFRLASSQRRFDRQQNSWIEMGTNWYTITAFRQLAANLATSIAKGDRVLAAGRLRIREWENSEKSGMTVEIEADSVGHDLAWGTSRFARSLVPESLSVSRPLGAPGASGAPSDLGNLGGPGDLGAPGAPGASGSADEAVSDGFLPESSADSELVSSALT